MQTAVELMAKAKELAKQDQVGWLTPEGNFVEVVETGGQLMGLSLGRHESTALKILQNKPDLFAKVNRRRLKLGCKTWPETTQHNLIKWFMESHGYIRVAPDILSFHDLS